MAYAKQTWVPYDENKSEEENIKSGAVGTAERMNHIEDGIKSTDTDLTAHKSDTVSHVSKTDRDKWDAKLQANDVTNYQKKKVTNDNGTALFKAGDTDTILAKVIEIGAGLYSGEATGVTSDSPTSSNVRLIVNMVASSAGTVIAADTQGNFFIRAISNSVWRDNWMDFNNLSINFSGNKVVVKKASTVENSTQLWYRADVSDKVINNSSIGTNFTIFSDDENLSYAKTAFFASPSKTSITGGSTVTRNRKVSIDKGFTAYEDNFTSTLANNTYLHVLIRVSQLDANKETTYSATKPNVKINGIDIPLEFVGIHTIGSPSASYSEVTGSDMTLMTNYLLDQLLVGVATKKGNKSDYVFFTVDVNQKFENNTGTTTNIQDSEEYKPVNCVLKLPDNYSPTGKPVPLVMWAHGAGGKITDTDPGEMSRAVEYFTTKGYALFDVNGSNNDYAEHADHMGSPRALSAYLKAYEYIAKYYNVEPRLFVHGHSMGGLLALNFAVQNKDIVKVLGLSHPVTDIYNQAWLKPWFSDTKKQIAIEFNFDDQTGAVYEEDKIIGYNPIKNHSLEINNQQYVFAPTPVKIWHGDADNVVDIAGSQKYIDAIKRTGGRASLRTIQGVGHTVTATMFEETRLWFDRFKESS